MIYVFDSSPLIDMFRFYYRSRFPTLWGLFDEMTEQGGIVSVKEVSRELGDRGDNLSMWVKDNSEMFQKPTTREMQFVATIFAESHFQAMIRRQERLEGKPVADPFHCKSSGS